MNTSQPAAPAGQSLSSYQMGVIALLAFLQFTIVLDFMILSPLGAILLPTLKISTAQFGLVVASYAFSAGISGILAAGFADRFDRKKLLLVFYVGFIAGTVLCGIARTYEFLLVARTVTGIFAGVMGSVVYAITTDLFSFQQRGRVMGIVQMSFSFSSLMGIPLGLYLSNRWGWNAPFLLIAGVSLVVGIFVVGFLRPIDAHLRLGIDRSPLHHLLHTISTPRYLQGFATTGLLSIGGFILMPYMSAFTVNNLGISLSSLPTIYVVTGAASFVCGPLIGWLSDAVGKFRVFFFGCIVTIIMVLIYTHLGITPIVWVIVVNVVLYVGVSSRMISSMALISAIPSPTDRGAYMSVSSSLQQIAGGFATALGGMLISQSASGTILHFENVGYVLVVSTLITLALMYQISRIVAPSVQAPAAAV